MNFVPQVLRKAHKHLNRIRIIEPLEYKIEENMYYPPPSTGKLSLPIHEALLISFQVPHVNTANNRVGYLLLLDWSQEIPMPNTKHVTRYCKHDRSLISRNTPHIDPPTHSIQTVYPPILVMLSYINGILQTWTPYRLIIPL